MAAVRCTVLCGSSYNSSNLGSSVLRLNRILPSLKSATNVVRSVSVFLDKTRPICLSNSSHLSSSSSSFFTNQSTQVNELIENLLRSDRACLSRAITLLESSNPKRRAEGQAVLDAITHHLAECEKKSKPLNFRIGLSGPPGAGKSTFIEALGTRLIGTLPWGPSLLGTASDNPAAPPPDGTDLHKVAVLAVDPSSQTTGGSLLADKTRMYDLSRSSNAYIRPSPSGGSLGGVARATNESVVLCEAAGYDIVLVETVGVGQSEVAVADMVDMFVLIIPPAGGDELQGLKRGIVEVADLVVVNKADGDLMPAARRIAFEYSNALKYRRQHRANWRPKVMLVSSMQGTGLQEFWQVALEFHKVQSDSGELQRIRKKQMKVWMWNYLKQGILAHFCEHPLVKSRLRAIELQVASGQLAPGPAAESLLELFKKGLVS